MTFENYVICFLIAIIVLSVLATFIGSERFKMIQRSTGKIKNVKRGFSYTYLFFGPLVPLFRGHVGGFFTALFIELFSFGIGRLVFCFRYNNSYIDYLVRSGYTVCDVVEQDSILDKKISTVSSRNSNISSRENSNVIKNDDLKVSADIDITNKIIDELKKCYACYSMKVYDENIFIQNKKQIIDKIYKINIKLSAVDFLYLFSDLLSEGIINEEDVQYIKSIVDEMFHFKTLDNNQLINLLLKKSSDEIYGVKCELERRGISFEVANKIRYYNDIETIILLKEYAKLKKQKGSGESLLAIKEILKLREIDVDVIYNAIKIKPDNIENILNSYMHDKKNFNNLVKAYKREGLEKTKINLVNFIKLKVKSFKKIIKIVSEYLKNIGIYLYEKLRVLIYSKKFWISIVSVIALIIITSTMYNIIVYATPNEKELEKILRDNLYNYDYELLNSTISDLKIVDTIKEKSTCVQTVEVKFQSDDSNIEAEFHITFKKGDKEWVFSKIELDNSSLEIVPIQGVGKDELSEKIKEYLASTKIKDIKWNDVTSVEVVESNEDLESNKAEYTVNLMLENYFYNLEGDFKISFKFDQNWNLNKISMVEDSIKISEKDIIKDFGTVDESKIKADLISNGIYINNVINEINDSYISAISVKNCTINKKENNMIVEVEITLNTDLSYVKGVLPIQYYIDSNSANPAWIMKEIRLSASDSNENLIVQKASEHALEYLNESTIKDKLLNTKLYRDSYNYTIMDYCLEKFEIKNISEVVDDKVKVTYLIQEPKEDGYEGFFVIRLIEVESTFKFVDGDWVLQGNVYIN